MKTELQKKLAAIAPSICIETIWDHDNDCGPISKDCEGFAAEDDDDWQAWMSEIRASVIHNGEVVTASAYLGGTWEAIGDHPSETNPEISGYEPQMTQEALGELADLCPDHLEEITKALHAIAASDV